MLDIGGVLSMQLGAMISLEELDLLVGCASQSSSEVVHAFLTTTPF